MLERLAKLNEKYTEISASLEDPAVISDIEGYTKLLKEYKNLTPIIDEYRRYLAAVESEKEARTILDDSSASELHELAQEEFTEAKATIEDSIGKLKILLLPRDPNDDKNVIVEIRAGTGGDEAALFAAVLFRMYSMYCDSCGFKISVANANETDRGGFKEITFSIEGDGAYSRFKFESGVHRVQRVPETESQGRIHTSAATVAVLPEADAVEVEILPADLIFESCKSSGAGGQHINKTESAVRLTHKPTGIVIECQQERSQFQNKDKALAMLRAKLYDMKRTEQENAIAGARRSMVGSGDRSEKIRTYNYPQNRVTDHRIGLTLHSLDTYVDGNIGEMIDALIAADTAERLRGENQ
ncbi:MAG: peptide chain release factor 1 [Clostridia bacterium]|nr:peptide chain release factor 1 [Clostridia bacterium]